MTDAHDAKKRREVLERANLETFIVVRDITRTHPEGILCLCCGLTSHYPRDVEKRYCQRCKQFHLVLEQAA